MRNSVAHLTPPAIGRRYGISPDKVVGWIRSGELRAVNVATTSTGRPRWRVSEADLADFETRRSAQPAPRTSRRRRRDPAVIEFF